MYIDHLASKSDVVGIGKANASDLFLELLKQAHLILPILIKQTILGLFTLEFDYAAGG